MISNKIARINDDYALLEPEGTELRFYYGYEVVENIGCNDEEADEVWCFQVKRDGEEVLRVPFCDLPGAPDMFEVVECLLAGLARWVSRSEAGR